MRNALLERFFAFCKSQVDTMRCAKNLFAEDRMKLGRYIISMIICIGSVIDLSAEQTIVDTIRAGGSVDYIGNDEIDLLMLDIMQQQAILEQQRKDSIRRYRLDNDTTGLHPFKLGYRDSILLSVDRVELFHYLRLNGLSGNPVLWTKHFGSPDFTFRNDTSFADVLPDDLRLRKIGGVMVLIPPTISESVDVSGAYTTAMIETDKSWLDTSNDAKQLKLKVKPVLKNWYKEATILLQVTQNYVSPNWYTGGSSSFAVLGIISGKLDYNDFDRITWENTLEWREGASTAISDTLRKVNMTEDMFRIYSKFNCKAYSKIYYSISAELQTQFIDTYKENTMTLVSSLLSPLRLNLNGGIDFKPVKGLSIAVSPLSFKFVYVNDTLRIKQTDFSVSPGRKSLSEIGSSVRVEYSYKPVREFSLDSKLYFYTNYKKVEFDLEVVANLIFSRYFSARVSLHPRYDNTVILAGDEKAKFQFKELVSVGFSHRFK